MTQHLPGRRGVAALLAMTLGLSLLIGVAPSASAAATVHRYDLSRNFESITRNHGSVTDEVKRIVISPETMQVVIDPQFRFPSGEAFCGDRSDNPALAGVVTDDWSTDPTPTVAVTPGAVVAGSGTVFTYECNNGEDERDTVIWTFVEGPGAGATIILGSDDATLVQTEQTLNYGLNPAEAPDALQVQLGDSFVVAGAPGLWTTGSGGPAVSIEATTGDAPDVTPADAAVSPDAAELSFMLPADLDTRYQATTLDLRASATAVGTGVSGSILITHTLWSALVDVTGSAKATSEIHATLDRTYTLSVLRPKLTFTVTTGAVPNDVTTVAINIDGVDQILREIVPSQTKVTVSLPTMPRGVHHIVVRYLGTTDVEGSTSGQLRLRVLI